jgi:hypothetical protein
MQVLYLQHNTLFESMDCKKVTWRICRSYSNQHNLKVLPSRPFSFAASVKKLSPEQQEIEELTNEQASIELLSQAQVNELVQRSDTPQALAFNLMQLMPGASESLLPQIWIRLYMLLMFTGM